MMRRTGKGLALSEVETYPQRNDFRIIHAVSNVSPTDVGHHVLGYIPSGRSTSSIGRKTYPRDDIAADAASHDSNNKKDRKHMEGPDVQSHCPDMAG